MKGTQFNCTFLGDHNTYISLNTLLVLVLCYVGRKCKSLKILATVSATPQPPNRHTFGTSS